ncbi:hypothetical protein [Pantoea agglomerans]|uniref:hypothetical protein n=1 Tax=Enterobacter agglomerans TaxID=549 RepID=UPI00177BC00A|nr:hypothetical protein [Pantoea agglomerans]MBD8260512.1 hypothetical protein [Pantoea agglomerans]
MKHLDGLKRGDPVIYDRLGEQLNCKFIELAVVRGKNVASVYHVERGLFLAPPSMVRVSPELERIL